MWIEVWQQMDSTRIRSFSELARRDWTRSYTGNMGGSQSTEIGQPSKLSAPLPGLRWELQSRPNGLVKIEDFRLVEEVSDTVLRCTNPNPNPNMAHARCTPRLTLHHVLHTPQAIDCSQLEDGEVIVKCEMLSVDAFLRTMLDEEACD